MISSRVFSGGLRKCFQNEKVPERIVVAVSGGVDSLCLTHLLCQYRQKYQPGLQITAITVDHGYRVGSRKEGEAVGRMVELWGVDHLVKTMKYEDGDVKDISNFEEVARRKRYEIFQQTCHELGVESLLLAHNLNDQLETFLQRLQQNSSMLGLVGLRKRGVLPMAPTGPAEDARPLYVIRPLLGFDKSNIISTCTESGIRWFEDHTNYDVHLTRRNLLRRLINEEIPNRLESQALSQEDRRCMQLVSKLSLIDTHKEVVAMNESVESGVRCLREQLQKHELMTFVENGLLLQIVFPLDILWRNTDMVLSRFLYLEMYPISSVAHYHWSYAKLERQAVPRILLFCRGNASQEDPVYLKITFLNVLFKCTLDTKKGILLLNLSRQPIIHGDLPAITLNQRVTNNWTNWVLFDRRYWLKLRLLQSALDVTVIPYNHKKHRKQLLATLKIPSNVQLLSQDYDGSPLIIASHPSGTFMALPSYDIYSSGNILAVEWRIKANLYSLC